MLTVVGQSLAFLNTFSSLKGVVEDAVGLTTELDATAQPGDSLLPYLGGGDLTSSRILSQIPSGSTISISGLVPHGLRGGCAPHESLSLRTTVFKQ